MSRSNAVLHRPGVLAEAAGRYRATTTGLAFLVSIFGAPLAPLGYLVSRWHQRRFHETLEILLTRRDLVVRMGVWFRQEKSIPLEKITDVALLEGPLMRVFGVKGLRVETAGQVSGAMGLVNLVGIAGPEAFRDRILAQRDHISDVGRDAGSTASAPVAEATAFREGTREAGRLGEALGRGSDAEAVAVLREIRDLLRQIEARSDGGGTGSGTGR